MKKILILTAILFINNLYAQELQVPASLKNLTEQTFRKYPNVQEMNNLVRLNQLKVGLNKAEYLPILTGEASYVNLHPLSYVSLPIGGRLVSLDFYPLDNYNAGVNLYQPLIDIKTFADVDKAENDLTLSNDNFNNFKIQLAYQVAQIYYGIIFLNKSLAVESMQLNLLNENIKQIETKMQNGDALKYDLLSSQVRYKNIENTYTELQNQLKKQYNILNMLTGNEGYSYLTDSTFSFNNFGIISDSAFGIVMENNPDILIAKDKIESSYYDVNVASSGFFPTLGLIATAGWKNGYAPNLFVNIFNYSVGVTLSVPILSASHPWIRKEMADVNLESSQYDLLNQKIIVKKDLQNTLEDVNKNEKELVNVETLLSQAELALTLATERYKDGVITNLDLLTAQTNYQDAWLSKLRYEYNLLLARMDLSRLAGLKWW
jgi:outer membrane protein TolC